MVMSIPLDNLCVYPKKKAFLRKIVDQINLIKGNLLLNSFTFSNLYWDLTTPGQIRIVKNRN